MNEEINENTRTLAPFTRLCMTIGNLPSSYFESMSYYEQLIWFTKYLQEQVIPAVNQNAAAVTELQQYYLELQDYVNNYFNNLDVQEEINKKLDEMAEDGSLTTLIGNYIQPLIDEQNERIEQIDTKVDLATSSTPLVASSTSGMTDTSRIYVNTTDGYWYYYDGDSWEQGGIYQSVVLGNKSVTYNNLDTNLQNSISAKTNSTNYEIAGTGVVNPDGAIAPHNSYGYFEINVVPNETYLLHIFMTDNYTENSVCWMFKDNSNNVISYRRKGDTTIVDNYYNEIVDIPQGASKMFINTQLIDTAFKNQTYIEKVNKYLQTNIQLEQMDTRLQNLITETYTSVTPTLFIPNGYVLANDFGPYAYSDLYQLSVNPGEKYRITTKQMDNQPLLVFTTNNRTRVKNVNDVSYTVNTIVDIIRETFQYDYVNYEFTIPSYCNKIYINKLKAQQLIVEKANNYLINNTEVKDLNKNGFNKLIAIGDSITEVNFRALHNYLYWIKQDIPSLEIQNLGASGSGYKNPTNAGTANRYVDRLSNISNYDLDSQIIIVMGSVNDIGYVSDSLGELGDTTNDTIYGAIYNFYNTLFTNLNGTRVGCISPLNWNESSTEKANLELYVKALKDTCELFNIPFLDIHKQSNLRPENTTFRNEYYEADGVGNAGQIDSTGVHPNSDGHHLFYARIKEFINTL